MKTIFYITAKLVTLIGISFGMMACSEVSFAPAPKELASAEAPVTGSDSKLTESFFFNNNNSERFVDVLFVVDNSTSMTEEQNKLGDRLDAFIGSLSQVDWQIGITSTDVSNGSFGAKGSLLTLDGTSSKILKATTPNYNTIFKNSVVRNETLDCQTTAVCPSNNEQPLRASMMAMDKRATANAGFFRENADLVIVILSDEDEMSSGPAEATSADQVIAHFKSIWGEEKKLSAFAIIVEPGDSVCYSDQYLTAGTYGDYAADLVLKTGGVTGSICDTDYSDSLSKIGENVNQLLNYIVLKKDPDVEGMDLVISPYDADLTWKVKGRRITFNKTPAEGTRIDVVYDPVKL